MKYKTIGTEQKLWIIGDSFTDIPFEDESWQYQLYKNTKGQSGTKSDVHWSQEMHNIFANYLITNYPEYFNQCQ